VSTYLADRAWDALGDGTRRAIFEVVASAPSSVGEIASRMPVSRPAVSQHLKVLAEAGLVTPRADGARRIYSADAAGLAALRSDLERFWQQALDSFKTAVEDTT